MDTKRLFLAVAGAVAASSAVQAMPVTVPNAALASVADPAAKLQMSDAAREQILGNSNIHQVVLAKKPRGWVQMGEPWLQWKGQVMR